MEEEQEEEDTSPAPQRSSSLSPPPDTGSPGPTDTAENADEATAEDEGVEDPKVEQASRHSTPLSELSPPPEQEESEEAETPAHPAPTSAAESSDRTLGGGDSAAGEKGEAMVGKGEPATVPLPSPKSASVADSNAVASSSQVSTPKDTGSRQSSVAGPTKDKAARLLEMNEELFK